MWHPWVCEGREGRQSCLCGRPQHWQYTNQCSFCLSPAIAQPICWAVIIKLSHSPALWWFWLTTKGNLWSSSEYPTYKITYDQTGAAPTSTSCILCPTLQIIAWLSQSLFSKSCGANTYWATLLRASSFVRDWNNFKNQVLFPYFVGRRDDLCCCHKCLCCLLSAMSQPHCPLCPWGPCAVCAGLQPFSSFVVLIGEVGTRRLERAFLTIPATTPPPASLTSWFISFQEWARLWNHFEVFFLRGNIRKVLIQPIFFCDRGKKENQGRNKKSSCRVVYSRLNCPRLSRS